MRAVLLPSGDLALHPSHLAALAPGMMRQLEEAQRSGVQVDPDIVDAIELADVVGAAWRNRRREVPSEPNSVPIVDGPGTETVESMSVRDAAKTLGISERAVTKRCTSGTLRAHMVKGRWRVHAATVRRKVP